MFRVRLRFSKGGALRFIGHLDFLRVFQQTIRRAGLPAAFSQGFNPHLLLSFALPLPLGMSSENDYADVTLEEELSGDEIVERLNAAAPDGLAVKAAYPVENKAASIVTVADYSLITDCGFSDTVQNLLQSQTIVISKKTKSGIKDTDIRPDIFSLKAADGMVHMRLSAGSARFLHPMTVAELILGEKPNPASLSRLEMYQSIEGLTTL